MANNNSNSAGNQSVNLSLQPWSDSSSLLPATTSGTYNYNPDIPVPHTTASSMEYGNPQMGTPTNGTGNRWMGAGLGYRLGQNPSSHPQPVQFLQQSPVMGQGLIRQPGWPILAGNRSQPLSPVSMPNADALFEELKRLNNVAEIAAQTAVKARDEIKVLIDDFKRNVMISELESFDIK